MLRAVRKRLAAEGIGARELERRCGLAQNALHGLLGKRPKVPSVDRAKVICDALDLREICIGPCPADAETRHPSDSASPDEGRRPTWPDSFRFHVVRAARIARLAAFGASVLDPRDKEQARTALWMLAGLLQAIGQAEAEGPRDDYYDEQYRPWVLDEEL